MIGAWLGGVAGEIGQLDGLIAISLGLVVVGVANLAWIASKGGS
jgi:hypothetical protein